MNIKDKEDEKNIKYIAMLYSVLFITVAPMFLASMIVLLNSRGVINVYGSDLIFGKTFEGSYSFYFVYFSLIPFTILAISFFILAYTLRLDKRIRMGLENSESKEKLTILKIVVCIFIALGLISQYAVLLLFAI